MIDTGYRYADHFQQCGMPRPECVPAPPVQLKGFNGLRSSTRKGMKWTVRIGQLWGNITSYFVPGSAPFLLSRRVLEGMAATLDLGRGTISSEKHGRQDVSLRQASNGQQLLPLTPPFQDEFQAACVEPVQAQHVEPDSSAVHHVHGRWHPQANREWRGWPAARCRRSGRVPY